MKSIGSLEVFKVLPSSLRELSLEFIGSSDSMRSEAELIEYFPETITSLVLYLQSNCTAWKHWMRRMVRFQSLETLLVTFSYNPTSMDPITLDFVSELPDSITDLELPLSETLILPEQMKQLPKRLTSFSLHNSDGSENAASDACFAHLPASLVVLDLPTDLSGLTVEFYSILPSAIAILIVPDNIAPSLKEYYAREPEWEPS
jgi:hypothetical protein